MTTWLAAALLWVVAVSLLAFALCGLDKRAARRHAERTPEAVLLGVALVGGSPGLFVGMVTFRHKTRKVSFLARFLVVIILQAGAAIWAWRVL